MKQLIFYLFFAYIVLGGYAQTSVVISKNASRGSAIYIDSLQRFIRNDSLFTSFHFSIKSTVVKSGETLHLAPMYKNNEGKEWHLPKILVNGKRRAGFYRREEALAKDTAKAERHYAVLTQDRALKQSLRYASVIRLDSGMQNGGTLYLEQYVENCCDMFVFNQPTSFDVAVEKKDTIPPSTPMPITVNESSVSFIRPEKEAVKERDVRMTVRINYMAGKADLLPNHTGNMAELTKLDNIVSPLYTNKEIYRITRILLKGYSSPEGSFESNLRLSQRRVDNFRSYLISRYGFGNSFNFTSQGLGEDWDGLRLAVEQSSMPYAKEVKDIIDRVSDLNTREKMIAQLAGGQPFKYMLEFLYPPLRRIELQVNYIVRPFDINETDRILQERPKDLSQQEIFDIAVKLKNNDLLKTAALYFPEDPVANINAASVALLKNETDIALSHLKKAWNDPRAYNNIGVYYLITKDIKQSEDYFLKALMEDKEKATYNLKLIEEMKKKAK